MERTLNKTPGATPADRERLQELARRIVNKLLHDPVRRLRESDGPHAAGAAYLHAMEKLFELEMEHKPEPPPAAAPPSPPSAGESAREE